MIKFEKICKNFESLSQPGRAQLLKDKADAVLVKLRALEEDTFHPVEVLATFVVGAAVADGVVDEQEFLLMRPALVRLFGADFDFQPVKDVCIGDFKQHGAVKKATKDMLAVLGRADSALQADVILLCLCIVSVDGKINLREKNYVKQLCKV